MTSTYRENLVAAQERLAHLEASHADRELQRLRKERASITSTPPPQRSKWDGRRGTFAMWTLVILLGALKACARANQTANVFLAVLLAAVLIAGSVLIHVRRFRRAVAAKRRKARRDTIARLDAEIAALENGARPLEVSTIEDAFVRIAELEAEEAAFARDARGGGPTRFGAR